MQFFEKEDYLTTAIIQFNNEILDVITDDKGEIEDKTCTLDLKLKGNHITLIKISQLILSLLKDEENKDSKQYELNTGKKIDWNKHNPYLGYLND